MDNKLSFGSMSPQMGNANQILGAPPGIPQQGPSSAGFTPGVLPPQPGSLQAPPQMSPVPGAQPVPGQQPMQPQPQGGTVGLPPGNNEALKIIQALASHLAQNDKLAEMSHPNYQREGVR